MFAAVWAWCDVWFDRAPGWPEAAALGSLVVMLGVSLVSLRAQGFVRAVTQGPRRAPRVAITFDDGPDPELTPQVLATLERLSVRATFFVLGEKVEAHGELVQRLRRAGHEIGNHGFTHHWQELLTPARAQASVGRTQDAVARAATESPGLYRPVYGLALPAVASAARRYELAVVGWTLRTRDGTGRGSPEARVQWTLERARPGSIILLHDGPSFPGQPTPLGPAMLEPLVAGLRARGLEPVTVSELMGWR